MFQVPSDVVVTLALAGGFLAALMIFDAIKGGLKRPPRRPAE